MVTTAFWDVMGTGQTEMDGYWASRWGHESVYLYKQIVIFLAATEATLV